MARQVVIFHDGSWRWAEEMDEAAWAEHQTTGFISLYVDDDAEEDDVDRLRFKLGLQETGHEDQVHQRA